MRRGRVQISKKPRHGKKKWSRTFTQGLRNLLVANWCKNQMSLTSLSNRTKETRQRCTSSPADGHAAASSTCKLIWKTTTSSSVTQTELTHSEEIMRNVAAWVECKAHNPNHPNNTMQRSIVAIVAVLLEEMQEGQVKLLMAVSLLTNSGK